MAELQREATRSGEELAVLIVDVSRLPLESELTHPAYRDLFASSLSRYGGRRPADRHRRLLSVARVASGAAHISRPSRSRPCGPYAARGTAWGSPGRRVALGSAIQGRTRLLICPSRCSTPVLVSSRRLPSDLRPCVPVFMPRVSLCHPHPPPLAELRRGWGLPQADRRARAAQGRHSGRGDRGPRRIRRVA
jgi:hypothetical protein